jgi:hypothetical protein
MQPIEVVVPGGPERRAAFAQNPLSAPEFHGGGFGFEFFPFPALLLSQFLIQFVNFLMLLLSPCCPMMPFEEDGLYFSTHNCESSPSCEQNKERKSGVHYLKTLTCISS